MKSSKPNPASKFHKPLNENEKSLNEKTHAKLQFDHPNQPQTSEPSYLGIGSILDEKYEILGMLGAGGMGAVYKARHLEMGNLVAIKILLPHFALDQDALRRFQREARIIATLRHQNILSVLAFGMVNHVMYMVTELIDGSSLEELIHRHGPMKAKQLVPLLLQVCEGMTHAHQADVLHRDLKPGNLLVIDSHVDTPNVKIVDFGLARILDGEDVQRLTRTGEVVGDPHYMSPEQAQGRPLSQTSDIYSFGCLLYEALTGAPPFVADNTVAVLFKQVNDCAKPFPPEMNVPSGLQQITFTALEKEPSKRYGSFAEVTEALRAFMKDPEAKTLVRKPRRLKARSISPRLVIASCLLGIVLTAGASFWLEQKSTAEKRQQQLQLDFEQERKAAVRTINDLGRREEALSQMERIANELADQNKLNQTKILIAYMLMQKHKASEGLALEATVPESSDYPQEVSITRLYIQGAKYLERKDYQAYEKVLERIYSANLPEGLLGSRVDIEYPLAQLKLYLGEYEDARVIIEKMSRPVGESMSPKQVLQADYFLCTNQRGKAEEYLRALLKRPMPALEKSYLLAHFVRGFARRGYIAQARHAVAEHRKIADEDVSLSLALENRALNLYVDMFAGDYPEIIEEAPKIMAKLSSTLGYDFNYKDVALAYYVALKKTKRLKEAEEFRTTTESASKIPDLFEPKPEARIRLF